MFVRSINGFCEEFKFREVLVGLMLIMCNAVEHISTVLVGLKDTMDLDLGIVLGSSVQTSPQFRLVYIYS